MKFRILFGTAAIAAMSLLYAGCGGNDSNNTLVSTNFKVRIENVAFTASGVFDTPITAGSAGPAFPDDGYEFSFDASDGQRLSFATMFGQSNDLFFAPMDEGIELFSNGTPISGDITSMIDLWDAGTEVNEEPGAGPNQAPRQSAPDTGLDEDGVVLPINQVNDGYSHDSADELVSVMISSVTSGGTTTFTVRIDNISGSATVPTPLSPGVYVVHPAPYALFESGESDRGKGIERIAEDGDPTMLNDWVSGITAYAQLISPGAFAVHSNSSPIFMEGSADSGDGLENIAEDGNPANLAAALLSKLQTTDSGSFTIPVGSSGAGPAASGRAFEFTVKGYAQSRLSFATMFAQSNDLFFGPSDEGLPLFSGAAPISGNVTPQIQLWDAGTEVNEEPGVGAN